MTRRYNDVLPTFSLPLICLQSSGPAHINITAFYGTALDSFVPADVGFDSHHKVIDDQGEYTCYGY